MGRHHDDTTGRADDWTGCSGEDRADPDSWDDPDIADATEDPPAVEPADLDDNGEVPPCW